MRVLGAGPRLAVGAGEVSLQGANMSASCAFPTAAFWDAQNNPHGTPTDLLHL